MAPVATIVLALVFIAVTSIWTDRLQELRRRRPVSRRVLRVARKHRGETGMVVQVFWPVTPKHWTVSVDYVSALEPSKRKWFGSPTMYFFEDRQRHRPIWVAFKPGRHALVLETHGKRPQKKELLVDLGPGEQKLMLCWPAKRRVVTRERRSTEWKLYPLPPETTD